MVKIADLEKRIKDKKSEDKIDYGKLYPTPLDLLIAHKKTYKKYNHISQIESFLLECWKDKEGGAISVPSRFGKSETVVAYIAWLLIQYPSLKFMIVTYNQKLSKRFNKAVLEMVERFAPEILDQKDTKTTEFFETKEDGYVLTVSPGSTASGYGASVVLVDDLLKSSMESMSDVIQDKHEEFMDSVISTRLEPFTLDDGETWNDPFVIGIGTLYGHEDWLNRWHDSHKSLKLAALDENDESIWPERWSTKALLEKRRTMSSYNWNAMYMADPINRDGQLFKKDWLRVEDRPTSGGMFKHTGIFVDPAATVGNNSDNTAVVVASRLHDNRLYIREIFTYKKTMFENISFIAHLYDRFGPCDLYVEDVGFATGIVEGLQKFGKPARGWKPGVRDKESRIIQQLEGPLETGLIVFSQQALNNETFISEYERFPGGRHDDSVDAVSIAAEIMLGKFAGNPYTTWDGGNAYDWSPKGVHGERYKEERPAMHPYSLAYTGDGRRRQQGW